MPDLPVGLMAGRRSTTLVQFSLRLASLRNSQLMEHYYVMIY